MVSEIANITDFDPLYDLVKRSAPWGIGNMSIYAVSERIGAYLGLKPEAFLYLHAGPLVGWKNLTGCVGKPHRVPWSEVPPALRVLPNFEVENLLCEFRRHLHPRMMPISTETDAFISSPNGSKACT